MKPQWESKFCRVSDSTECSESECRFCGGDFTKAMTNMTDRVLAAGGWEGPGSLGIDLYWWRRDIMD